MNEISSRSYESIQYDSAPPLYSATTPIPMSNVPSVPSTDQPWDDFPLPPAYDSLTDLPIWSVPLTASPSNISSSAQQWDFYPQIPAYSTNSSVLRYSSTDVFSQATLNLRKRKFQRWKQALVAVLLFLGAFVQVGAGTVLASNEFSYLSNSLLYGIPFWAPVCYIITGSMLLSSYVDPTPCRVRLSISFDIITTILSIVGLLFNVKDLGKLCYAEPYDACYKYINVSKIHYVLVSTNVLLLCASIFAATFGFYILCCVTREDHQPSVIENTFVASVPPPDFSETPRLPPPPPYTPHGAYKGSTTM